MKLDLSAGDNVPSAITVRVAGRVAGRPWLWLGVALVKAGALCLRGVGVEVRIDEGPWERVWPRKP